LADAIMQMPATDGNECGDIAGGRAGADERSDLTM